MCATATAKRRRRQARMIKGRKTSKFVMKHASDAKKKS